MKNLLAVTSVLIVRILQSKLVISEFRYELLLDPLCLPHWCHLPRGRFMLFSYDLQIIL